MPDSVPTPSPAPPDAAFSEQARRMTADAAVPLPSRKKEPPPEPIPGSHARQEDRELYQQRFPTDL